MYALEFKFMRVYNSKNYTKRTVELFRFTIQCNSSPSEGSSCDLSTSLLESVVISMNVSKKGFHRELIYNIQYDPTPQDVRVLLIQRVPSGMYMDAYQLASLREDTGLQVLLDSKVDLEAPAYVSPGFSAFIYLTSDPVSSGHLQTRVPIHGRYHRPSSTIRGWETVEIDYPRLMIRTEGCETLLPSPPHTIVEASCTFDNLNTCSWLEIRRSQALDPVSLKLPVGGFSDVVPVCAGTLLVTLLCSCLLSGAIWKYGVFEPL
ncbi:phosphatidylinositol-glycan biosynthesis class X protein [Chanos chanos]|uniref:Phosphatidylinositol-glycan biosynthesis class X protein n=1 Tax=Chanos chanos TaxID=29144 RepID=A0A6J2WN22_CHACN|nr:phosphatidylinositol-glycan biosynthesis class X protein [Chanos chanos]